MAVVATTLLLNSGATAQSAGSPISMIVPYPPGSVLDTVARRMQTEFEKKLKRTLLVENISGASGSIGAQRMLSSDPGTTLLMGTPNESNLAPLALKGVRYQPQDFRLISHVSTAPLVLMVRPDFPGKDVRDLIDYAKKPGTRPLSYASTGNGSLFHLAGADFARRLGVQMTHVPYRGGAPAVQDLIGGNVDMLFFTLTPSYVQMAETGKIKVLGVLAPDRSTALPNAPAFSEIPELKGMYFTMWIGLFTSAKAPIEKVAEISKAASEIVGSAPFRTWLTQRGSSPGTPMTLQEASAFFQKESVRFETIARETQLQRE
jgi:tripartite-type tricarboxylate transporter receptor subunit TctC